MLAAATVGRQEPEGNGVVLQNAIQTSAAINPGNSGGALVNIRGSVIGIPTLAAADPQLGGAAAGIGFAIPSNTVKSIATQIIQHGHVVSSGRPYLGIQVGDTGNGVYVGSLTAGGPAAKAGIHVGDLIVSVNGKPLGVLWKTPFQADVTGALKPGTNRVEIKVTNLWPNRMIGDLQPSAAKRYTFTDYKPYTKDSPLLESGLLGPVTLSSVTLR